MPVWSGPARGAPLALEVVAPDSRHPAWLAAQELARRAASPGLPLAVAAARRQDAAPPDLLVLPLRSLAGPVPALQVLELPFLFPDLAAARRALDGALGDSLRREARTAGFELLAFWDEGLQVLSGNRRFDDAVNLTGMEFLLLRPDPVSEKQFAALDTWTRSVESATRDRLHIECLVGSREATLIQIQREELARVHLDLTLSFHRYEGYAVTMPVERYRALTTTQRTQLAKVLADTAPWQRRQAERLNQEALAALARDGMQVHRLTAAQRADYRRRLPAREALLLDELPAALARELLERAGADHPAAARQERAQPSPPAPNREQRDEQSR